MDEKLKEFWDNWRSADEIERLKIVETLTLPSRKLKGDDYKYSCASLINSYLTELEKYLEEYWHDMLDPINQE